MHGLVRRSRFCRSQAAPKSAWGDIKKRASSVRSAAASSASGVRSATASNTNPRVPGSGITTPSAVVVNPSAAAFVEAKARIEQAARIPVESAATLPTDVSARVAASTSEARPSTTILSKSPSSANATAQRSSNDLGDHQVEADTKTSESRTVSLKLDLPLEDTLRRQLSGELVLLDKKMKYETVWVPRTLLPGLDPASERILRLFHGGRFGRYLYRKLFLWSFNPNLAAKLVNFFLRPFEKLFLWRSTKWWAAPLSRQLLGRGQLAIIDDSAGGVVPVASVVQAGGSGRGGSGGGGSTPAMDAAPSSSMEDVLQSAVPARKAFRGLADHIPVPLEEFCFRMFMVRCEAPGARRTFFDLYNARFLVDERVNEKWKALLLQVHTNAAAAGFKSPADAMHAPLVVGTHVDSTGPTNILSEHKFSASALAQQTVTAFSKNYTQKGEFAKALRDARATGHVDASRLSFADLQLLDKRVMGEPAEKASIGQDKGANFAFDRDLRELMGVVGQLAGVDFVKASVGGVYREKKGAKWDVRERSSDNSRSLGTIEITFGDRSTSFHASGGYAQYFGDGPDNFVGYNPAKYDKSIAKRHVRIFVPKSQLHGAVRLLHINDLRKLFHELGHALHFLLSPHGSAEIQKLPQDVIELPSQAFEFLLEEPEVVEKICGVKMGDHEMGLASRLLQRCSFTTDASFTTCGLFHFCFGEKALGAGSERRRCAGTDLSLKQGASNTTTIAHLASLAPRDIAKAVAREYGKLWGVTEPDRFHPLTDPTVRGMFLTSLTAAPPVAYLLGRWQARLWLSGVVKDARRQRKKITDVLPRHFMELVRKRYSLRPLDVSRGVASRVTSEQGWEPHSYKPEPTAEDMGKHVLR